MLQNKVSLFARMQVRCSYFVTVPRCANLFYHRTRIRTPLRDQIKCYGMNPIKDHATDQTLTYLFYLFYVSIYPLGAEGWHHFK